MGQTFNRYISNALEFIVTSTTEVRIAQAEKDSEGATEAALVFQKISTMFWAYLPTSNITASTAQKFFWIVVRVSTGSSVTSSFATKVCLMYENKNKKIMTHTYRCRQKKKERSIKTLLLEGMTKTWPMIDP